MNASAAPNDPMTVADAARLLRAGKLCAFPTETVYGLGAVATNTDAVLSIYHTKGRPRFNPLIIHCADLAMAKTLAEFSPRALQLAEVFWPGPLSLVLPRRNNTGLSDIAMAGLDTVALRIPSHPLALELLASVGQPLAAPSANPSGKLSPTSAEQVRKGFAGKVPVLDGGPCMAGVESTIIAVDGDALYQLRAGGLARARVESVTGLRVLDVEASAPVAAPGMLASHYAPNAQVRLNVTEPAASETLLGFGAVHGQLNLSINGDLHEAARNLFAMLQQLDETGATAIAVAPIPTHGLGEAINDRLERAAAPR
ncbi:L-threonylcarbamoyladenylate synthase [Devosia rhodophyticola]|uniref:Threonylcarbamoyl-AMP synthase n=1 Tax=Devosia rhodophyticola TaxID=3026423 RepID=A0ABY7YYR0_9HYPH|nr:L-threonylcarbamoyladenylate synthase [Devosia rhodophyticola]WDR06509.1 L-threonylcarbamoyladenylate synthase [Devosia rhodophyticola]